MPTLIDQIDSAANLARWQAQEFRNLAATTDDQQDRERLLGRAEALCRAVTEMCSLSMTNYHRRRALTKLLLQMDAAAEVLDELKR